MRFLIVLHWYMHSTSFRVFPPLLGRLHACTGKLLRLPSGAPAKNKNLRKEANLAGVPDDRPNSTRVRMTSVIGLRWPMPRTSFG